MGLWTGKWAVGCWAVGFKVGRGLPFSKTHTSRGVDVHHLKFGDTLMLKPGCLVLVVQPVSLLLQMGMLKGKNSKGHWQKYWENRVHSWILWCGLCHDSIILITARNGIGEVTQPWQKPDLFGNHSERLQRSYHTEYFEYSVVTVLPSCPWLGQPAGWCCHQVVAWWSRYKFPCQP